MKEALLIAAAWIVIESSGQYRTLNYRPSDMDVIGCKVHGNEQCEWLDDMAEAFNVAHEKRRLKDPCIGMTSEQCAFYLQGRREALKK